MAHITKEVNLMRTKQQVKSIPIEVTESISEYFSLLGEPMRLRLLSLLRDGERCVQDLVDATQTSQANVSKHLKIMWQAGLVKRRSEGTSAFYSVDNPIIFELYDMVYDEIAERVELQASRFRTILKRRA